MNTEEKAKAYDEALKRARKIHDQILNSELLGFPDQIREIFPELEENEDERIRKYLIEELKAAKSIGELKFTIPQPTREECIAYLEKQKDLAAIPDELVKNYKLFCGQGGRELALLINAINGFNKLKEQKPAEKPSMLELLREHLANTPKEQLDAEFEELKEFTIPKPAEWSEEDEKKMIFLERLIEYNVPDGQYGWADGRRGGFVTKSEAISMLKSLRNRVGKESLQPHWKPSEEQIYSLGTIVKGVGEASVGSIGYNLKELYEHLKKLWP